MKYNTPEIQKQIIQHIKNNTSGTAIVRSDDERRRIPSPSGFKSKLRHSLEYYNTAFKFRLIPPSQLHPFDHAPTTYKWATAENVVYVVEVLDNIDAETWSTIMATLNRSLTEYVRVLEDFKVSKLDRRLIIMIDEG